MDTKTLKRLESLNQLSLTEAETEDILAYFAAQDKEKELLDKIDTADVERMVHVMPLENVLREDVAVQNFTRDELQSGAPEATDGYWQVPRLVE